VSLPAEWSAPNYQLPAEDRAFMKKMIARSWPSRIFKIDEYGTPWIAARICEKGRLCYYYWGIFESSGWRRVERRSPVTKKKH
jgi:hypothetical protein